MKKLKTDIKSLGLCVILLFIAQFAFSANDAKSTIKNEVFKIEVPQGWYAENVGKLPMMDILVVGKDSDHIAMFCTLKQSIKGVSLEEIITMMKGGILPKGVEVSEATDTTIKGLPAKKIDFKKQGNSTVIMFITSEEKFNYILVNDLSEEELEYIINNTEILAPAAK